MSPLILSTMLCSSKEMQVTANQNVCRIKMCRIKMYVESVVANHRHCKV